MYCTRCGKKIDYDAFVCNECVKQEQIAFTAEKIEATEPVIEATAETTPEEPVTTNTATAEPVDPQPTYTAAPNNQQYYYSNQNPSYQQNAYQNNTYTNTTYQPQPAPVSGNPRMNGFGKSLASTILGFSSYIFSAITLGIAGSELPDAAIVLLMMTLGMAIPSLIMGIKSIKTFTSAPKQGLPRPIVTLILGIIGLSLAAIALFICFICLILVGAIA